MIEFHVKVADPDSPRVLEIWRSTLTEVLLDYAGLAREGWRMVDHPWIVRVDERSAA
jgi:hypothetical protein